MARFAEFDENDTVLRIEVAANTTGNPGHGYLA